MENIPNATNINLSAPLGSPVVAAGGCNNRGSGPPRNQDVWSYNLRSTLFLDDCDSDTDCDAESTSEAKEIKTIEKQNNDPGLVAQNAQTVDAQLLKELDLSSREEPGVSYRQNPFSIAKINAAVRREKQGAPSNPIVATTSIITTTDLPKRDNATTPGGKSRINSRVPLRADGPPPKEKTSGSGRLAEAFAKQAQKSWATTSQGRPPTLNGSAPPPPPVHVSRSLTLPPPIPSHTNKENPPSASPRPPQAVSSQSNLVKSLTSGTKTRSPFPLGQPNQSQARINAHRFSPIIPNALIMSHPFEPNQHPMPSSLSPVNLTPHEYERAALSQPNRPQSQINAHRFSPAISHASFLPHPFDPKQHPRPSSSPPPANLIPYEHELAGLGAYLHAHPAGFTSSAPMRRPMAFSSPIRRESSASTLRLSQPRRVATPITRFLTPATKTPVQSPRLTLARKDEMPMAAPKYERLSVGLDFERIENAAAKDMHRTPFYHAYKPDQSLEDLHSYQTLKHENGHNQYTMNNNILTDSAYTASASACEAEDCDKDSQGYSPPNRILNLQKYALQSAGDKGSSAATRTKPPPRFGRACESSSQVKRERITQRIRLSSSSPQARARTGIRIDLEDPDEQWSTLPPKKKRKVEPNQKQTWIRSTGPIRLPSSLRAQTHAETPVVVAPKPRVITFLPPPLAPPIGEFEGNQENNFLPNSEHVETVSTPGGARRFLESSDQVTSPATSVTYVNDTAEDVEQMSDSVYLDVDVDLVKERYPNAKSRARRRRVAAKQVWDLLGTPSFPRVKQEGDESGLQKSIRVWPSSLS